jgi:hypothetical protein
VIAFLDDHPASRSVLGILLVAIGLACFLFVVVNLVQDLSLWVLGRRTIGQVVDMWAEPISAEGSAEIAYRYYVRYEFTTPKGEVISGTSSVAASEWSGLGSSGGSSSSAGVLGDEPETASGVYQEQALVPQHTIGGLEKGMPIAVVYFSLYPRHNRLDESRFVPILACAYLPLLVVGSLALVGGLHLFRSGMGRREDPTERAFLDKIADRQG